MKKLNAIDVSRFLTISVYIYINLKNNKKRDIGELIEII